MISLLLTALIALPVQDAQEHASLRYGREAMEAGEHEEARDHFLYALARSAEPREVLALLLENAQGDADARILWTHEWLAASADAKGRFKPGKLAALMPEDDEHLMPLVGSRAEAVKALLKYRGTMLRSKKVGAAVLAEWAEDVARSLTANAPVLYAANLDELEPTIAADRKRMRSVIGALGDLLRLPVTISDDDLVVRAARCLRGLAAQERFETPYGPPSVTVDPEGTAASSALARRRAAQASEGGVRIWAIEELEDLDEDQIRGFTLEHASFSNPGVALSPQAWYRVETNCGHGTLLGASETVEYHHQRLVNWFGEDPFIGRPGTLRLVPESHGLEMENAPFWWAGGFQGGDITTLKFTRGRIPGLGRGITHELTHRFDGGVYGGLPGWLAEGRAVWTGGSYGFIEDTEFVEDYVNYGTMGNVLRSGYGNQGNLERLITGDIEDYRDNYSAGYALFVYLRSWAGPDEDDAEEIGRAWYAERLEEYMRGKARRRGDGLSAFANAFADGEDGRPDGMEAFAEDYREFLQAFTVEEPPSWIVRYDARGPKGEGGALVYDEPTFSWLRARAEPWFGQDQARIGAELLADAGQHEDSVEAYTWALAVDEPSDSMLERFAGELDVAGNEHAAWVVRHWARYSSPGRDYQVVEAAPQLAQLRPVVEYAEALSTAARAYAGAGHPLSAAALAAEHDQLAWSLGLPLLGDTLVDGGTLREARLTALHPFDPPALHMDLDGWTESGLTGHEDRRVDGLWCVDDASDLHVGRKTPRTGTDTMDRNSPQRDAFVHSTRWQDAGRYRLKAKIELTTAFLSGGIVVGWTRRDRAVRINFSGGDWDYAYRQAEKHGGVGSINWRISGAYAQDDRVSARKPFEGDASTFDLEVLVDGPTVELFLDGDPVGSWTALDAHPVQGHIGFYTSSGAMRVIAPQVQRLDRSRWSPIGGAIGRGVNPHLTGEGNWRDALDRPVGGIALAPSGTMLMWFGVETDEQIEKMGEEGWVDHVFEKVGYLVDVFEAEAPSQGITVVLPDTFPGLALAELRTEYAERVAGGFAIQTHTRGNAMFKTNHTVGGWARVTLGFIDPVGVLRVAQQMPSVMNRLTKIYRDQLRTYQDHIRPGQAGARE